MAVTVESGWSSLQRRVRMGSTGRCMVPGAVLLRTTTWLSDTSSNGGRRLAASWLLRLRFTAETARNNANRYRNAQNPVKRNRRMRVQLKHLVPHSRLRHGPASYPLKHSPFEMPERRRRMSFRAETVESQKPSRSDDRVSEPLYGCLLDEC